MEEGRASLERSSSEASSYVADRLPHTNNVIRGQEFAYSVGRKVAHGKYGAVFEVLRKGDGKLFAAKLEVSDTHFRGLNTDYNVLKDANRAPAAHFARLIDRGKIDGHFKFMVMQMLGPNLDKLRQDFQGNRFSAPTALRLGVEMLAALEELHSLNYVHRDVKPANFVMNKENERWKLYLVDFGLCKQYRDKNGDVRPPRENIQFRGTLRYASLTAHNGQEQSPRDDVESWFYVMVEFFSGDLPWSGLKKKDRDLVKEAKETVRTADGANQLLQYCPKTEFRRIMKYVDDLGYLSQPDYSFLIQMVQLAMKNNDIKADQQYDWEYESDESEGETAFAELEEKNGHSEQVSTAMGQRLDQMVQNLHLNGKS